MPSTFVFGCLKLKRRFCEIPFRKSIVYSDVVLDKLRERYKSRLPSINAESCALRIADGFSPWVLKFSRLLSFSEPMQRRNWMFFVGKKLQEKHENHWLSIPNNIKVINLAYKFMVDRLSIL